MKLKRYNSKLYIAEQNTNTETEVFIDKKVSDIIKLLRDNNYTNEFQRKKLVDYLSSLNTSNDKRAKLVFKHIGNLFTEIGDEILNYFKNKEGE